jgi:hypothetical protein
MRGVTYTATLGTAALAFLAGAALYGPRPQPPAPPAAEQAAEPVGRYQLMHGAAGADQIFVIDTATGQTWSCDTRLALGWQDLGVPSGGGLSRQTLLSWNRRPAAGPTRSLPCHMFNFPTSPASSG